MTIAERKLYVQKKISPLLWQVTYDCLTHKPTDVVEYLKERQSRIIDAERKALAHAAGMDVNDIEDGDGEDADADDVGNDGGDVDEQTLKKLAVGKAGTGYGRTRRTGVAAESLSGKQMANYVPPVYAKSDEAKSELRAMIHVTIL